MISVERTLAGLESAGQLTLEAYVDYIEGQRRRIEDEDIDAAAVPGKLRRSEALQCNREPLKRRG
jgi:hypothetical protein